MKKKEIKTVIATVIVFAAAIVILLLLLPVEKKNQQREQYGKLAIQAETDEKSRYILEHIDEYPNGILNYYYNGDQFLDFVYNYPEHKNDYAAMSYTDDELNSEKPPRLFMEDMRWCYQPMGGGYIISNGCAAVSLTMAYIYLYNDGDIDPYKVAVAAEKMDAIGYFGGIDTLKIRDVAENIGFAVSEQKYCDDSNKKISDPSIDDMISIIKSGDALMAGCRGENFGDHAILITDYNNGMFSVNDPASVKNSEKLWSYEELTSDIYYLWDLSAKS